MAFRKRFIGVAVASIFIIGICLLDSVPQASAETLKFKSFNHVTKGEMFPIGDVEGHFVSVVVREGAVVLENGEWGWFKATVIRDLIKGAGTGDVYETITLPDGSRFTGRMKGTLEATPGGVTSGSKWAGDIIHGTGRFQGMKGTIATSSKLLPPEKDEPMGGKNFVEGTVEYTLPSK